MRIMSHLCLTHVPSPAAETRRKPEDRPENLEPAARLAERPKTVLLYKAL
jgi:hypothetical protein